MNLQHQIDGLIARQAAQWYDILQEDNIGAKKEFTRWIAESPRHLQAFLDIASNEPVIQAVAGSFDVRRLLNTLSSQVIALPTQASKQQSPRQFLRGNWKVWAAAAAAAVLVAVATVYEAQFRYPHYDTLAGEQRTIQLSEGSLVNLNTQSRLEVQMDSTRRDIHLLRGEATFKVSRDRTRPFRVYVQGLVVTAIGTQFNVYARPDGSTRVSVLEGKVKVANSERHATRSQAPLPLSAGQEALVLQSGDIERRAEPDVREAVAWQQRKLIFKRSSLKEMVQEFNRYNQLIHIRLEGTKPESFRFSGVLDADDPLSLAALLMHEPDFAVEQREHEIVIRLKQ